MLVWGPEEKRDQGDGSQRRKRQGKTAPFLKEQTNGVLDGPGLQKEK